MPDDENGLEIVVGGKKAMIGNWGPDNEGETAAGR